MIVKDQRPADDARKRPSPGPAALLRLLVPALAVVTLLFGGGLILGLFQSLGYLPTAGMGGWTLDHVTKVFKDPDFFLSLGLTLYIALISTAIAAAISVVMALVLNSLLERNRLLHFIFQIPLTVPHLVIAVAVVFMMSPAGLFSRAVLATGLIESSDAFPLLINDRLGIGIMLAYVWKEVPFITLIILSVLRSAGNQLNEVGRTLKANRWQRFRYITLPTIFPALGAACLIVFAYTFGAFEVPFLLGQTYPMLLPVAAYKNYSDVDLLARPEGIATGLVIAGVVMLAIILSQVLTKAARRRGVII